MIRSVHMNRCLAAQICFLLFKGPGSFKTIFKIGGNVDRLKAYRLKPLTPPPPPFSFYTTFNVIVQFEMRWVEKSRCCMEFFSDSGEREFFAFKFCCRLFFNIFPFQHHSKISMQFLEQ
jgi:hypothetical protein